MLTKLTLTYVSLVVCTDEPGTVQYLNFWDEKLQNFDVNDDYKNEKALVKDTHAASGILAVKFSYSAYIGKIILGPFARIIDELDEN